MCGCRVGYMGLVGGGVEVYGCKWCCVLGVRSLWVFGVFVLLLDLFDDFVLNWVIGIFRESWILIVVFKCFLGLGVMGGVVFWVKTGGEEGYSFSLVLYSFVI